MGNTLRLTSVVDFNEAERPASLHGRISHFTLTTTLTFVTVLYSLLTPRRRIEPPPNVVTVMVLFSV